MDVAPDPLNKLGDKRKHDSRETDRPRKNATENCAVFFSHKRRTKGKIREARRVEREVPDLTNGMTDAASKNFVWATRQRSKRA